MSKQKKNVKAELQRVNCLTPFVHTSSFTLSQLHGLAGNAMHLQIIDAKIVPLIQ